MMIVKQADTRLLHDDDGTETMKEAQDLWTHEVLIIIGTFTYQTRHECRVIKGVLSTGVIHSYIALHNTVGKINMRNEKVDSRERESLSFFSLSFLLIRAVLISFYSNLLNLVLHLLFEYVIRSWRMNLIKFRRTWSYKDGTEKANKTVEEPKEGHLTTSTA